jgi:predicted dehydrogenase
VTAPLRLAIVGCGGAARQCHVPGLLAASGVELVAAVDPVADHADGVAELARELGNPGQVQVATELAAVAHSIDAAVIASPHDTHAALVLEATRRGIHCLVEKPMALSAAECAAMVASARAHNAVLGVAHVRRLFPASQRVKGLLADRVLGRITHVSWREGGPYDWPLVTPSLFRRSVSGGGVLADGGPHVLDLLLWWLDARSTDVDVIACSDSSLGGAESEARIALRILGIEVSVVLSRVRPMENTCVIRGSDGSLEFGTDTPASLLLRARSGAVLQDGTVAAVPPAQDGWAPLFSEQLRNFAAAIRGREAIYVRGDEAGEVVDIVQRCYAVRTTGAYPWRVLEAV